MTRNFSLEVARCQPGIEQPGGVSSDGKPSGLLSVSGFLCVRAGRLKKAVDFRCVLDTVVSNHAVLVCEWRPRVPRGSHRQVLGSKAERVSNTSCSCDIAQIDAVFIVHPRAGDSKALWVLQFARSQHQYCLCVAKTRYPS